jgi:hypothetical protein
VDLTDDFLENFQAQAFFMSLVGGTSGEDLNAVIDDHSPEFRPYAEMSRERLTELLDQAFHADDTKKWAMLAEFIRDGMTREELRVDGFASRLLLEAMKEMEGLPHPHDVAPLAKAACVLAKMVVKASSRKLS